MLVRFLKAVSFSKGRKLLKRLIKLSVNTIFELFRYHFHHIFSICLAFIISPGSKKDRCVETLNSSNLFSNFLPTLTDCYIDILLGLTPFIPQKFHIVCGVQRRVNCSNNANYSWRHDLKCQFDCLWCFTYI